MESVQYKNIGNIRDDYAHEPRIVTLVGLVTSPNLVLKMYQMAKKEPMNWDAMVDSKKFLTKEIENGNIESFTGLGFAILSEDMLNVARWDTEYPIVLKNQIYGYTNHSRIDLECLGYDNMFESAELLDTKEVGSFCIWELSIVNYERNAWEEYLRSDKTRARKEEYLESTLEGVLK